MLILIVVMGDKHYTNPVQGFRLLLLRTTSCTQPHTHSHMQRHIHTDTHVFCSESSSFRFIMATMACRSSTVGRGRGEQRLKSEGKKSNKAWQIENQKLLKRAVSATSGDLVAYKKSNTFSLIMESRQGNRHFYSWCTLTRQETKALMDIHLVLMNLKK